TTGSNAPNPLQAAIFNNNGAMLLEHERGDTEGALALFQRAVKANPNYAIGYTNLGIAYAICLRHDYKAAIEALNKAEQLGGSSPTLFFARGLAKSKLVPPDYAGSEKDLRAVAQKDSGDAFTHYHLAMALKNQTKLAEAEIEFKAAIQRLPNF